MSKKDYVKSFLKVGVSQPHLPFPFGVMDSRGRLSLRFVPRLNLNAPQRISLAVGKYHSRREYHVIEDNISRAIGTYPRLSLRFVPPSHLNYSSFVINLALAHPNLTRRLCRHLLACGLGHLRGKTILNRFFTLSGRFATPKGRGNGLNLNAPQRISLAAGKYTPCGACHFVSIVLRTLLTLR